MSLTCSFVANQQAQKAQTHTRDGKDGRDGGCNRSEARRAAGDVSTRGETSNQVSSSLWRARRFMHTNAKINALRLFLRDKLCGCLFVNAMQKKQKRPKIASFSKTRIYKHC